MEIISLKCNNCGANLQVNEKTVYLQCTSCGSSLAVKKSINTVFTEVLGEVRNDTNQLVNQSKLVLIEKEIERLDREWTIEREQYKIQTKHNSYFPDEEESTNFIQYILGGVVFLFMGGFMFFWISTAPSHMKPFGIGLVIMMALGGFSTLISTSSKTSKYQTAKAVYLEKRKSLLKKLDREKV